MNQNNLPRFSNAKKLSISELPRGNNNRALCRYCGIEVPPKRRSFCSKECVHEYRIRTQPRYIRDCIYKRDKGICQMCNVDTRKIAKSILEANDKGDSDKVKELMVTHSIPNHRKIWKRKYGGGLWDADHIVPVCEGGGMCGLVNIRTLCLKCHKDITITLLKKK